MTVGHSRIPNFEHFPRQAHSALGYLHGPKVSNGDVPSFLTVPNSRESSRYFGKRKAFRRAHENVAKLDENE